MDFGHHHISSLWEVCHFTGIDSKIQEAAHQASGWTADNDMEGNTDKTKGMTIYFGKKLLELEPITMNNSIIEDVTTFKLLGLITNNKITWNDHIEYICSKASKRIYFLVLLRRAGRPPSDIIATYISIIRSVLEYVCTVWHPGLSEDGSDHIEHIQKRCLKIAYPDKSYQEAMSASNLVTMRETMCQKFFEDIKDVNHKLHYLLPPPRDHVTVRDAKVYELPKVRTKRFKDSPINYLLFNYQ
jgi:hypothetical protein